MTEDQDRPNNTSLVRADANHALAKRHTALARRGLDLAQSLQPRIVHFPEDRSIGHLLVRGRTDDAGEWRELSDARGVVAVQGDQDLWLWLAEGETSALDGLAPDDLFELSVFGRDVGDENLSHFAHLTGLKSLRLDDTAVTGTGLLLLSGLANLETLGLLHQRYKWHRHDPRHPRRVWDHDSPPIGLANVEVFPALRALYLKHPLLSDKDLVHLGRLAEVTALHLSGHYIVGQCLTHSTLASSVEVLSLDRTALTDTWLRVVGAFTRLRSLYLGSTQVTDAGLANLEGLSGLEFLCLCKTRVNGSGLVHFGTLGRLRELHLAETMVLDSELTYLASLVTLQKLDLSSTGITDAGLARLQAALPGCRILR